MDCAREEFNRRGKVRNGQPNSKVPSLTDENIPSQPLLLVDFEQTQSIAGAFAPSSLALARSPELCIGAKRRVRREETRRLFSIRCARFCYKVPARCSRQTGSNHFASPDLFGRRCSRSKRSLARSLAFGFWFLVRWLPLQTRSPNGAHSLAEPNAAKRAPKGLIGVRCNTTLAHTLRQTRRDSDEATGARVGDATLRSAAHRTPVRMESESIRCDVPMLAAAAPTGAKWIIGRLWARFGQIQIQTTTEQEHETSARNRVLRRSGSSLVLPVHS